MNNKLINLSPKFDFFFTFPFNLGFSIERSCLVNYQYSLGNVANLLKNVPNYLWSMEIFDDNLPLSLKNKGGIILGKPAMSSNISNIIKTAFEREKIGAIFDGVVKETIVYFDHGVGSINLTITATLENINVICFLFIIIFGTITIAFLLIIAFSIIRAANHRQYFFRR